LRSALGDAIPQAELEMVFNRIRESTPTPDTLEMYIDVVKGIVGEMMQDHDNNNDGPPFDTTNMDMEFV
jgi:hypothetical protein